MVSSIMTWVMAHQALVGMLGVAVLDFLFGVNPNLQSNGVVHFIYLLFVKEKGSQ